MLGVLVEAGLVKVADDRPVVATLEHESLPVATQWQGRDVVRLPEPGDEQTSPEVALDDAGRRSFSITAAEIGDFLFHTCGNGTDGGPGLEVYLMVHRCAGRAYLVALKQADAMMASMSRTATSMNLAVCVLGSADVGLAAHAFDLDASCELPIGLLAVGSQVDQFDL